MVNINIRTGFFHILISQIFSVLSGISINIFLSRFLGQENFGLYTLIISGIMVIGLTLVAEGFPQTLSKYISEEKHDLKKLSTKILLLQLIEAILILIFYLFFSSFISRILNEDILFSLLILASFMIPTQALISFIVGLYNGLRKFHFQSIFVSILSILKSISVIFFALFFGIKGAIFGYYISSFMISLLFLTKERKMFTKNFKIKLPKEFYPFFIRITVYSFLLSFLFSLDLNFLKYFIKTNENSLLGIYSAGVVVARILYFIVISFSGVMFPIISNLYSKNLIEEAKKKIGLMITNSAIFILPITLILSSSSTIYIPLLFGEEYKSSEAVTSILIFGYTILGFFVVFARILHGIGDVKTTNLTTGLAILLDILLLYFLIKIKEFSIIGAAISTTISSLVGLIILSLFVVRRIGIEIKTKRIIRITLLNLFLFFLLNLFFINVTSKVYIWVVIFTFEIAVYFSLLHIFKDLNIISFIRKIHSFLNKHERDEI